MSAGGPPSGRDPDSPDFLEIALRAYVPTERSANKWRGSELGPSDWTLIFDCETNTDTAQTLRFGVYQVRRGQELWEAGYFVNPEILTEEEIALVRSYADKIGYQCLEVAKFIDDVFYRIGYDLQATIVGFNLPFDISRIAIGHGPARGRTMKGGFSFQLSPNRNWPNVQIKHLSSRVSLIRFPTRPGFVAGRGMRKRKIKPVPRPGHFIDVRTLTAALTSRSFDLAGSADFLGTEHRKVEAQDHGKSITEHYLFYAKQDVQVTFECYCKLLDKFAENSFKSIFPHQIFSEASIGKAYFKEMNIRPFREVQPDFPDYLLGIFMSTYFGGRAEVHHRRIISQVIYCDFLSMYPTVCTRMGLWRFVIASGLIWRDSTAQTANFLQSITIRALQKPETWQQLTKLVQIAPDVDILPVRAAYGGDAQTTIGLNYVSSDRPLWFTLADCIASKLLTGKTPGIIKAITFHPQEAQSDLHPVMIAGNSEYRIDPYKDDFYRRVIDLRSTVKKRLKEAEQSERPTLDSTQQTLKILANSTSYGNFVELNVEGLTKPQLRQCYGYAGEPFTISTDKGEEPGKYFHPLIATLITGAARLMLAITEHLTLDAGLDWALCDTDSMAIAKPERMTNPEFIAKVEAIRHWFTPLNPYAEKGSLLKFEDVNSRLENGNASKTIEPLYCFAISAKRYALFNIVDGEIIIRKASAHGLGHLLPPYKEADAPAAIPPPATGLVEIGVERWQYDLWYQIVRAAIEGHPDQVNLDYHPNLRLPAASRYAATTPSLLRWFAEHNACRAYPEQVKPSNFLLAYQIAPASIHEHPDFVGAVANAGTDRASEFRWPKPVACYDSDSSKAAKSCFDRDTGNPVSAEVLKTYKDALAQHHLRPEHKFQNGNYTDRGITKRRHVRPSAIRHIGKESNRWEEQFYLGGGEGAEVDYGLAAQDSTALLDLLRQQISKVGQRKVARESGVSRRTLARFLSGQGVRASLVKRMGKVLQNHRVP